MAKDKSKKTEAPVEETKMKKSKKAAEPEAKPAKKSKPSAGFAKPSEAPATGGDGWSLEVEDHIGKLFLITPYREEDHPDTFSKTPGAVKQHIVCDVVEINEKKPEKSVVHKNIWAYGGWVRGSLRGYIGTDMVLGVLEQDTDKGQGKNKAWVLEDADDDQVEAGKAYLASVDPFATPSDDGKKSKKAKK
ncbi:MAG: hypothetical protein JWO98_5299 [Frankiales bacterium]|nr:hypothetical protein [Frankiales bacterium]